MALERRRPAGGGAPRGHSAPLTVLAGVLLLPSVLAYSLTNCSVSYSDAKAVDCSQRQLTALPGDIPRDAVSLDLTLNMLSELKVIHFRDFLRLQVLIAATNNISRLEDGVFVHLVSLRELNLSNNGLRILTDNMFQGLSNLSLLKLSSNHIMHISPLSFKQLPNVKVVMVDFNALSGIEDVQPILELQHLEMLDITGNSLSSFRSDSLRLNVSSNLRALHISYNPMREFSITADAFPDLQAVVIRSYSNWIWEIPDASVLRTLTSLDLGETTLSFEDYQAILQSSDSVEELTLSWVKDWIDEGILDIACKVSSLRTLRLKWNSIDYVNDTLLQSCSQLTKLVLTLNGLNGLGGASLQSMTRLEILEMDYNSLSEVPVALRGLLALKILTLSNNGISGIRCADFFNLTQLTELHLENNHFSKLDACAFTKLNNLKVLNLRQNWLFTLGEAFKVALKNLEMLDLSGNCFVEIKEGAFGNLSSLKFLNLETEKIPYPNVAKAAFKSLVNLETLLVSISSTILDVYEGLTAIQNLSINIHYGQDKTLSTFGPSLSDASSSLKSLRIANYDKIREIKEIELLQVTKHLEHFTFERFSVPSLDRNTFKHTPQLKTLRMTQGEITVVNPELFQSIPNLEALDLSANRLKSLDFLAQVRFSRLSWLKVSQNQLSVVNESVFRFLPALTYLDMMDNPLNCDCSNSGFQRWLQSTNQTQVVNGHQLICTHPLSKDGSAFLDFDIHSCWMDISFLCYICTTCLTGVVLITSLTYNFLKWQVVYAYYLFLALLYDRRKWRKGAPQHYDAFISYNVHDEAWVHGELLPALEGEQGRRLCLHHRDFQPGKAIIDNITDAIYGSRKTICIISRHYLESEWCSREIQLASFRLFDEKKDVLILLFLEDLPARQLSPYYRMRWLMKRSSYLSWPVAGAAAGRQAVFWENVCRALDEGDAASDDSNLLTGP